MDEKNRKFIVSLLIFTLGLAVFLYFFWPSLNNYRELVRLSLAYPFQIDYGEGPLLDQVNRLARGETIYQPDFTQPPYTISNYPPVFLLFQVPFYQIFGPAFWYGRLISVVSALLAALLIGLTLHTLTRDALASTAGGLLLLAYPYVQFWSVLNRIDLLALALSWAAIFTAVRWNERRWGIPLAAFFFVASIFTRQSYALAAPLAVFVWLLVMRVPGRAVRLAAMVGGVSLGLFLLLTLFTGGGFFLNIVTANVNPFSWDTVRRYMEEFSVHSMPLLILAGLFFLLERTGAQSRSWPLALTYAAAAGLAAVTVGKDGSNVNYMLEAAAGLCFAAGASMAWLGRGVVLRLAVLAALVFQLGVFNDWTLNGYNGRVTDKTDQQAEMARLAQIIRDADGVVLIDEEMGLVPLAGKRLYFQPFEYKMLAEGELWDETAFLQSIRDKEFNLIIQFDTPYWPAVVSRWTHRSRTAIRDYYDLETTIGFNRIYRPKK